MYSELHINYIFRAVYYHMNKHLTKQIILEQSYEINKILKGKIISEDIERDRS